MSHDQNPWDLSPKPANHALYCFGSTGSLDSFLRGSRLPTAVGYVPKGFTLPDVEVQTFPDIFVFQELCTSMWEGYGPLCAHLTKHIIWVCLLLGTPLVAVLKRNHENHRHFVGPRKATHSYEESWPIKSEMGRPFKAVQLPFVAPRDQTSRMDS